jgi:hypothetical protein
LVSFHLSLGRPDPVAIGLLLVVAVFGRAAGRKSPDNHAWWAAVLGLLILLTSNDGALGSADVQIPSI